MEEKGQSAPCEVTVRSVAPSDAEAIAEIYNEYVVNTAISFETEALSVEAMRGRVADLACKYPYFVAEADGRVVGYCYAHNWKERAAYGKTWETTVYVDSSKKHCHIGEILMDRLIEECRRAGCHALIACITGNNSASIAFHQRLGFKQVSMFKEVGFKFGRYLDIVDYELML
ncbi:MAG: GNAT family N-acetyltransferase [Muribaculum sp.]|nr:GNAT family N-acetyltransferase [Muribaculum sp.]